MVERHVANVNVEGSSPFARFTLTTTETRSQGGFPSFRIVRTRGFGIVSDVDDDNGRFNRDDLVELTAAIYGYEAGSRGVVQSIGPAGALLVRFSDTGNSVYVDTDALKQSSAGL